MFGNFFGGEKLKEPTKIEEGASRLSAEDKAINDEINEIGKVVTKEQETDVGVDYVEMVSQTREKARISHNLVAEILRFTGKYGHMPLQDLISEINQSDSDFDDDAKTQLNYWINEYEEEINFKGLSSDFVTYLSEENKKCEELLNPGPEKKEKNKE